MEVREAYTKKRVIVMLIFVFVTFKSLDIVSRDGSFEVNFLH
jgi:hypothetical protein